MDNATVFAMTDLAEALREIAGKIDPQTHAYHSDACQPYAELDDYHRQVQTAFTQARASLS